MKALIRKDFYVLKKQFLLFAVIILVFRLGNMPASTLISIFYAVMLPSSAFAYDDLCHWDTMELMLPYSTRQIVLSRYCVGWLSMLFFLTLGWLVRFAAAWACGLFGVFPQLQQAENVRAFLAEVAIAAIFLALSMPIYFRFDAEKSRAFRTLMIVLIAVIIGGAVSLMTIRDSAFGDMSLGDGVAVLSLAAAALTAASIPLSVLAWRRRHQ